MQMSRLQTENGPRWAVDGFFFHAKFSLGDLLALPLREQPAFIESRLTTEPAHGALLAPIEPQQEIWASGVTYLRSREAREAESATGDIYQRVYAAQRPELFFKANGWRVVGPDNTIRVRRDSRWNVPEPELTLVFNTYGEICGYTPGNDVSSRDIEGENPLYLPQAKVYNGACALGPAIQWIDNTQDLNALSIRLEILRNDASLFVGETSTSLMRRTFEELASYLFRELDFPLGVFLLTGTGIVPPEEYSLQPGDSVRIDVGDLRLWNVTG